MSTSRRVMPVTERWRESVEEHRDALESWAASDLPLADDWRQLLDAADAAAAAGGG